MGGRSRAKESRSNVLSELIDHELAIAGNTRIATKTGEGSSNAGLATSSRVFCLPLLQSSSLWPGPQGDESGWLQSVGILAASE